jgi:hypothetical protein
MWPETLKCMRNLTEFAELALPCLPESDASHSRSKMNHRGALEYHERLPPEYFEECFSGAVVSQPAFGLARPKTSTRCYAFMGKDASGSEALQDTSRPHWARAAAVGGIR